MCCFLLIILLDWEENVIMDTHTQSLGYLVPAFISCMVGLEKLIFAVKMEHVKMLVESQVEKRFLLHTLCPAGILPALDLVLHIALRLPGSSWSSEPSRTHRPCL